MNTLKEEVLYLINCIRVNTHCDPNGRRIPDGVQQSVCSDEMLNDIERMVQEPSVTEWDKRLGDLLKAAREEVACKNKAIEKLTQDLQHSFTNFTKQGELFDRVLAVNQKLIEQSKPATTLRFFNGRLQQQVNQEWVDVPGLDTISVEVKSTSAFTQEPKCSVEGCDQRRYGGIGGGLLCFHHLCERSAVIMTSVGTKTTPINDRTCSVQGCMRLRMEGWRVCGDHMSDEVAGNLKNP